MTTYAPDSDAFEARYRENQPQVVWTKLVADLETPVSAMLKLASGQPNSFLLESVEGAAMIVQKSTGKRGTTPMHLSRKMLAPLNPSSAWCASAISTCLRNCLRWRPLWSVTPDTRWSG